MTQKSNDTTKLRNQAFEKWLPPDYLLHLRVNEDGLGIHSIDFPSENDESEDDTPKVSLSLYVELLSALTGYVSWDRQHTQETGFPNTHAGWVELIGELTSRHKAAIDNKIATGAKTAHAEPKWKKLIVNEAWQVLSKDDASPGWSRLRTTCKTLAKDQGRSKADIATFTEHYCKEKIRHLRLLSAVRIHKGSE